MQIAIVVVVAAGEEKKKVLVVFLFVCLIDWSLSL